MKNKSKVIPILELELVVISRQIGIHPCEIPKLWFDFKPYITKIREKDPWVHRRKTRDKVKASRWGECSTMTRNIFINPNSRQNLRQAKDTLIHELVHYRFHGLPHGREFEKRIKEIRMGRRWPIKQIQVPQGERYLK